MTLEEARSVVEAVSEKLDEDAKLIWGAQISPEIEGTIRVLVIVTGVKSSQIKGRRTEREERGELEDTLGIEFIA